MINIGSIDGLRAPAMETYAYSASKAAVHQLTRHLAKYLAPKITVNAIAPGPFESKMMHATLEAYGEAIASAAPDEAHRSTVRHGRSGDLPRLARRQLHHRRGPARRRRHRRRWLSSTARGLSVTSSVRCFVPRTMCNVICVAGMQCRDHLGHVLSALDRRVVDAHDDVALLHARRGGARCRR